MIDVDKEIARRIAAWRATVAASVEHGANWYYVDVLTMLPCILPAVSADECERIAKRACTNTIFWLNSEVCLELAESLIRDAVEREVSAEIARAISPLPGLGGRA